MPIDPGYGDYKSVADMFARPAWESSGLDENFAASVGEMFDEYSSFSGALNSANYAERDGSIKQLISSGQIPEDILNERQKYNTNGRIPRKENDYSALAEWANENLTMDSQLQTDTELKERRDEEMEMRRKYREDIFSRATTGGKAIGFVGTLLGGALDPAAIAGGFFTGGAKVGAVAASRALYARSLAIRAGIGGLAGQAAVEPFIWAWQEETNGEYTIAQSVANLAIAGVFSAGLSGTAGLFGHASALKAQKLRGEKKALIEENLAFKEVDQIVEVARTHHKETTLELEAKLDRLPEDSLEIDRIQMRLMEEDAKLENILKMAEQGPDDLKPLIRLFDELEILKDVDGLKVNLEERYRAVEEAAERMRQVAHVIDSEPVIPKKIPEPKTKKVEPKKAEPTPEPKTTKKTTTKKTAKKTVAKEQNLEDAKVEYHTAKRDLQKLYDEADKNRAEYYRDTTVKDLERKVAFYENKISKTKDPDLLEGLEDELAEFQDALRDIHENGFTIDDGLEETLHRRFGIAYNKRINAKLDEIKSLEKELGVEGIKDPIDEAVDNIGDEVVMIDENGNKAHITEIIETAEAESRVYKDTMLCVMRNSLG